MYIHTYTHTSIHTYIHSYVYTYMCTYEHLLMVCMSVDTHKFTLINTSFHSFTRCGF